MSKHKCIVRAPLSRPGTGPWYWVCSCHMRSTGTDYPTRELAEKAAREHTTEYVQIKHIYRVEREAPLPYA